MKKFFFIFFGFFLVFAPLHSLEAIGVAPTVIDFDLEPGTSQEREIVIVNEDVAPLRVTPTIFRVRGTDEHGFPLIEVLEEGDPLEDMISFPKGNSFVLGIGEKRTVPIRVSLDGKTPPGGHYAVISWGAEDRAGGVALSGQPGVNVAIAVRGNVSEGAEIRAFSLSGGKRFVIGNPVLFTAVVANTGGRHVTAQGTIEIRTILHTVAAVLPLGNGNGNGTFQDLLARILPGTERAFVAKWNDTWALGPYFATLTLEGSGVGTVMAETMFFAASPLALLVCFLILSSLIVFLLRSFFRTAIVNRLKK